MPFSLPIFSQLSFTLTFTINTFFLIFFNFNIIYYLLLREHWIQIFESCCAWNTPWQFSGSKQLPKFFSLLPILLRKLLLGNCSFITIFVMPLLSEVFNQPCFFSRPRNQTVMSLQAFGLFSLSIIAFSSKGEVARIYGENIA